MMEQSNQGFTLLEMLLALTLSAVLMATISTMVMPLIQTSKSQTEAIRSGNETSQMRDLFDTAERIANRGIAAFPSSLDRGRIRTSLAIQFMGTGHDMYEDANGDGAHGIANMDPSGFRSTSGTFSFSEDDDNDGLINEDQQNGLDDDNDGLIDEDPGNNDDDIAEPGKLDYDDNNDDLYDDETNKVSISSDTYAWSPFIPNSLYAVAQSGTRNVTYSKPSSNYKNAEDDNEDGVSNNGPIVTWSARLETDQLICTTPLIEHVDSSTDPTARLRYEEYVCLENVQRFEVTRTHNGAGSAVFDISLSFIAAGETYDVDRRLVFP